MSLSRNRMWSQAISCARFTPLLRAMATIEDLLLTIGVSIGGVELVSPASASAKSA